MRNFLKLVTLVSLSVLAYLFFWPVPIDPVAWAPPNNNGYQTPYTRNEHLSRAEKISLGSHSGPEDYALRSDGIIATGVHSGEILLFDPASNRVNAWVNTGGRPLGLEFDADGNLVVADGYLGLLKISSDGEQTILADRFNKKPMGFVDDLDIAENGKIYFSDASEKFSPRDYGGTLEASLIDLMEHGGEGKIYEYDPTTKITRLVADNLNFANGVTVTNDQLHILVNETGHYRVLKIGIADNNFGAIEIIVDNLPGFPDNIARAPDGNYWLGLAAPRSSQLDALAPYPFFRKVVQRLPSYLRPQAQAYSHVIKIDESGKVLESLQDPNGLTPMTTGVLEVGKRLYLSSLSATNISVVNRY